MISFINRPQNRNTITKVIGVSGTFGKTIVTHLIAHILRTNGFNVSYLSSDGYSHDGVDLDKSISANKISRKVYKDILSKSLNLYNQFFIVELSSSQIKKNFLKDVTLDIGVVTNIVYRAHRYSDWEEYAETKLDFIKTIEDGGLLVINSEDPNTVSWIVDKSKELDNNIFCYWIDSNNLMNKHSSLDGLKFNFYDQASMESSLVGNFNFSNIYLAARACSRYLEINQISSAINTFDKLPGRLDRFDYSPFHIFIDHARTGEQVQGSLSFIHNTRKPRSKIITVLSSESTNKRNLKSLVSTAMQFSNVLILAPSDSNTESTYEINSQLYSIAESFGGRLLERIQSTGELDLIDHQKLKTKMNTILNIGEIPIFTFDAHNYTGRLDAIKTAVNLADTDDIIYIAGKGNEEAILFNNTEYEWSDQEATRIALQEKKRIY